MGPREGRGLADDARCNVNAAQNRRREVDVRRPDRGKQEILAPRQMDPGQCRPRGRARRKGHRARRQRIRQDHPAPGDRRRGPALSGSCNPRPHRCLRPRASTRTPPVLQSGVRDAHGHTAGDEEGHGPAAQLRDSGAPGAGAGRRRVLGLAVQGEPPKGPSRPSLRGTGGSDHSRRTLRRSGCSGDRRTQGAVGRGASQWVVRRDERTPSGPRDVAVTGVADSGRTGRTSTGGGVGAAPFARLRR